MIVDQISQIYLNEEEYKRIAPGNPISMDEDEDADLFASIATTKFGHDMKKAHFHIDDKVIYLNHGSYGSAPKFVTKAQQKWRDLVTRQPLLFNNTILFPQLVRVLRGIADFVDCEPRDLVFCQNATTAINTILQSMQLKEGDKVITLNLGYDAVRNTVRHVCNTTKAKLVEVPIVFPIATYDELINKVKETLDDPANDNIKLCIFDHITSRTAFTLPIEQLINLCRERNIPVLIDGAHALGQVEINLRKLMPTFYTSNAHKWLCSPLGAAIMYVDRAWQDRIHPLVISHGFGLGFQCEFIWTGTMDHTPYLAVGESLEFRRRISKNEGNTDARVIRYNDELAHWAAEMLARKWGTTVLLPAHMYNSMAVIKLPGQADDEVKTPKDAEYIHDTLLHKFNIQAMIVVIQGKLWTRISAQVYNEKSDYETFGDIILEHFANNSNNKN